MCRNHEAFGANYIINKSEFYICKVLRGCDIMKNKFIKVFLLSAMIAVVITQAISISAATYITDGKDFYLSLIHI